MQENSYNNFNPNQLPYQASFYSQQPMMPNNFVPQAGTYQGQPMMQQNNFMQQPVQPPYQMQAAMQQNNFMQQPAQTQTVPQNGPNAVSINIISPQAYASNPVANQIAPNGYYSMYGQNQNPQLPLYPQNYNNLINTRPNSLNATTDTSLVKKTPVEDTEKQVDKKKEKTKKVTPLTDDYVKSLENYLNDNNPKIRLIGAKELMERFKEDENRKDNPSLVPLLNKSLRDTNAAVRFLALTSLQLGYSVGNDETIQILKEIQASTENKLSEDSILASEVLLKLCAPEAQEVVDPNQPEENTDKNKEITEEITTTQNIQGISPDDLNKLQTPAQELQQNNLNAPEDNNTALNNSNTAEVPAQEIPQTEANIPQANGMVPDDLAANQNVQMPSNQAEQQQVNQEALQTEQAVKQ